MQDVYVPFGFPARECLPPKNETSPLDSSNSVPNMCFSPGVDAKKAQNKTTNR